jgi:nucleotide-binding universal stress UspA family protein
MITKILVPVDGSLHANTAVDWASDVAIEYDAQLTLLHVITEQRVAIYPEDFRAIAKWKHFEINDWELAQSLAQRLVEVGKMRARSHGAKVANTLVVERDPAKTIVAQSAKPGTDLIVMGRRGLGNLSALILGSVTNKVLHLANCACLTVK